jgi:DNA gyrase inhibitor GyrI
VSKLDVRIVRLEPMRVASIYGFGKEPEALAYEKLIAWAEPRGLLNDPDKHRIFCFNNPHPSAGSPNYGYEFWITIGDDVEAEGDVKIQDFDGGLYAVMRIVVRGKPWEEIPAGWKRLDAWIADSEYKPGSHQWLQEHVRTKDALESKWTLHEHALDLYYPIAE